MTHQCNDSFCLECLGEKILYDDDSYPDFYSRYCSNGIYCPLNKSGRIDCPYYCDMCCWAYCSTCVQVDDENFDAIFWDDYSDDDDHPKWRFICRDCYPKFDRD